MARLTKAQRAKRAQEVKVALVRLTRDGLGRFVDHTTLKACDTGDCDLGDLQEATAWPAKFQEIDAALETVAELLEGDAAEREVAGEVLYAFRQSLREDAAEIEARERRYDSQRAREEYEAGNEDAGRLAGGWGAWVHSQEVPDTIDVTGLDADQARRLSLAIINMNRQPGQRPRGRVYTWRQGRRYVSKGMLAANLNDPVLVELGLDHDLWQLVHEGRLQVQWEPPRAAA